MGKNRKLKPPRTAFDALKQARTSLETGKVVFSSHAIRRMQEREIVFADIKSALADPASTINWPKSQHETRLSETPGKVVRKWRLEAVVDGRRLGIVFLFDEPVEADAPDIMEIVTVFEMGI